MTKEQIKAEALQKSDSERIWIAEEIIKATTIPENSPLATAATILKSIVDGNIK